MSTTANDISSRSAQEVGWIFVREYCYHLQEKPETLFQFYDKQSSLIRGLEGEEVKICQGQQEIKKNIAEMQLKDTLIKIINVDSLDFLDGKVVIQVIGEISNKGEDFKKFVRTVILVKHTDDNDRYYVLSDIFRYLKDENVNVIKQQSIDQEPSYIEDGLSTLNEEKSANGEDTVSSTGTLNEESAQESSRESKVIEDSVPKIPPTKTETPSLTKSLTEDSINQAADENSTENEKPNLSDVRSKVQPSPINVQTEKLATSSNATNQTISPTESRSPSKPSTWANLAASDTQKWDNSQLAESKGRVVQSPLTRTQSQQSNREHRDQRDRDQRDQSTRGSSITNREFSLYVKGITNEMTKPVLDRAFSKFGAVKNVDVVTTKSCAFVEFGNQEAYQQALSQKEIEVPGLAGHQSVFVEERKPKEGHSSGRRFDNYHRNSYNNSHNGINSQRAGRGGRNMSTRPPAKS